MKNIIQMTGIVATVVLLAVGSSFAQGEKTKMVTMKNKPEMAEMMKSPHHRVVMAYRQNVLTFSETLRDMAKESEPLNTEFAKALFSDIKRGSEMMNKVHKDHMSKMDSKKMNSEKRKKMAPMMEKMKKQNADLAQHIKGLGASVEAASIDSKEVEKHSSAIVSLLEKKKMNEKHKGKMKMAKKNM